jgi:glycosyltransferase involved in cell wall biosynthesis
MTRVSVVVETVNARFGLETGSLSQKLAKTMAHLQAQTYPRGMTEWIIVLDANASVPETEEIHEQWPDAKLLCSLTSNYFAAKNAGAAAATGEIVALCDSDVVPVDEWLEKLVGAFTADTAVVGGRTRYPTDTWIGRICGVTDFGYVVAGQGGVATGILLNNVAFRRDVLLSHPFDERIRRDGGCYLLFHQLRAEGLKIRHEPQARTCHQFDPHFSAIVSKQFNRGYDGAQVYALDDRQVLQGSYLYQKLGALSLVPIATRRVLRDWFRVVRHGRQMGVGVLQLPVVCVIGLCLRTVELAGGIAASLHRKAGSDHNDS